MLRYGGFIFVEYLALVIISDPNTLGVGMLALLAIRGAVPVGRSSVRFHSSLSLAPPLLARVPWRPQDWAVTSLRSHTYRPVRCRRQRFCLFRSQLGSWLLPQCFPSINEFSPLSRKDCLGAWGVASTPRFLCLSRRLSLASPAVHSPTGGGSS
jgi:hypothetical protein